MAVVNVVLFYICIIPQTLVYFASLLRSSRACTFMKPSINFIAHFALRSSSVVNPTICLSFVGCYRRGLRNILCSSGRKWNNKATKCEQITLKRIKHIPDVNCGWHWKPRRNMFYHESREASVFGLLNTKSLEGGRNIFITVHEL